jgi:DNA-binding LacI/PurR family transcriptional regulator
MRNGDTFTAVFVASDNVAIGAKSALREANLQIPNDVSIMGFDDIPWAKYSDPPLTTIRLPAEMLAQSACTLLLDLIQDHEQNRQQQIVLDTKLVIRESCLPL